MRSSVRAGLGRIPSPVNLFLNFVVDILDSDEMAADHPRFVHGLSECTWQDLI